MAVTINSSVTFAIPGGVVPATVSPIAGDLQVNIAATIPGTTTNQELDLTLTLTTLQSIFLVADGALTLKTNSTSAPGDTLTFAANMPLCWVLGMPFPTSSATPFSTNVTKFYLTNAGSTTVHLYGQALVQQ